MKERFDLTTHQRNAKGQIVHVQPYRLHIDGATKMFERPPGSGKFYAENNELIKDTSGAKVAQEKAAHDALVEKIRAEERAKLEEELKAKMQANAQAKAPAQPAVVKEEPKTEQAPVQGDSLDPAAGLKPVGQAVKAANGADSKK